MAHSFRREAKARANRMIVDETVLPRGAALLANIALRYLEQGWD